MRLPMLRPCNHIRRDEHGVYGCAVLGKCKPILAGPDLSKCERFSANGVAVATVGKCQHLGDPTGGTVECESCKGKVLLKVIACEVYGECTIGRKVNGVACCVNCPSFKGAE